MHTNYKIYLRGDKWDIAEQNITNDLRPLNTE